MKKLVLLFTFLILRQPAWAGEEMCVPSADTCGFYLCANQALACRPQNYLVDFGYRYCAKFVKNNAHFSPYAQLVLREIRYCLQENLYFEKDLTCSTAKRFANQHHVDCYVEKGFCDIPFHDKLQVFAYIRKAVWDPEYRQTMKRIQWECSHRNSH